MFVLVRHAVAVSKQDWSGADRDRPLNRHGLRQSDDLVELLEELGIVRLLSSPTVRCEMTLAPASARLSVPIEFRDALSVGAPIAELLRLLDSPDIEDAALCTHGETFSRLSRAWSSSWPGTSRPPKLRGTPKGSSWLIDDYATTSASARPLGTA